MPKTELSKNQKSNNQNKKDFSEALSKLESMILTGVFRPRERLVENNLSFLLGVSRFWVRDALKILEAKGLVTVVPYKGAYVSELSEKEIEEIFFVRVTLEQSAVSLALENAISSDIQTLRELAEKVKQNYERGVFEEMIVADTNFHHYIFELAQNQTLTQMIVELRKRCQVLRYTAWSSPDIIRNILQEHDLMIDALEKRDANKLNDLAKQHISHAKQFYLSILNPSKVISSRFSFSSSHK